MPFSKQTPTPKIKLDAARVHCFSYGEDFSNIAPMIVEGHEFLTAAAVLKNWLEEYQRDQGCNSFVALSAAQ